MERMCQVKRHWQFILLIKLHKIQLLFVGAGTRHYVTVFSSGTTKSGNAQWTKAKDLNREWRNWACTKTNWHRTVQFSPLCVWHCTMLRSYTFPMCIYLFLFRDATNFCCESARKKNRIVAIMIAFHSVCAVMTTLLKLLYVQLFHKHFFVVVVGLVWFIYHTHADLKFAYGKICLLTSSANMA